MAGKTDKRRPARITEKEWSDNWALAFKTAKKNHGKWTAVHPKWRNKQSDITNLPEIEDE